MSELSRPTVALPSGERVPQLGQGTWGMGESLRQRKEEIAVLRLGIKMGQQAPPASHLYDATAAEIEN
jgi:diketogulonate reductase-like aldo/keto reductase